eukprot:3988545-Amphidinium_carterae.2
MHAGKGGGKGYGKDGGKGQWQAYTFGSSNYKQGGKGYKGGKTNEEREKQRAIKAKQEQVQVDWMARSIPVRLVPPGTQSTNGPTVGRGRALLKPAGQVDQLAHSMPGIPEGGGECGSPNGPYPSNSEAAISGDSQPDPFMTQDPWGGHFSFCSIQVAHSATTEESYSTEC